MYSNNQCTFKDITSNFYLLATDLNHYLYLFLKAAYKFLILRNPLDSNDVMEATVRISVFHKAISYSTWRSIFLFYLRRKKTESKSDQYTMAQWADVVYIA